MKVTGQSCQWNRQSVERERMDDFSLQELQQGPSATEAWTLQTSQSKKRAARIPLDLPQEEHNYQHKQQHLDGRFQEKRPVTKNLDRLSIARSDFYVTDR